MIYLIGDRNNLGIIYDEKFINEEDKKKSIAVSSLPVKEDKPGYFAFLCVDEKNTPYWNYVKNSPPTLEFLVENNLLTKEQYKALTGKDFTI
jgi:hypothetical protein